MTALLRPFFGHPVFRKKLENVCLSFLAKILPYYEEIVLLSQEARLGSMSSAEQVSCLSSVFYDSIKTAVH